MCRLLRGDGPPPTLHAHHPKRGDGGTGAAAAHASVVREREASVCASVASEREGMAACKLCSSVARESFLRKTVLRGFG